MSKITTADFKKGIFILFRDEPCQITENTFVNPGKGSAFVRTKLKNLKTGRVQEFTYKSGETVEEVPVVARDMQYLYAQGDEYIFMDERTFDQVSLPKEAILDFAKYIKEGTSYQLLVHEGKALGMRIPSKVRLKVVEAEDAARGNTVMGAKKYVKVETGASVIAPIFIKEGETIIINPETDEYAGREGGGKY